ncbi:hypothetical protein BDZ91DRAFT_747506 [Kalaharituber pfeilii]|nr:hypothetical protein BDZ91DRAFT_747506 [Kalaharituber pfeilii]
MLRCTYRARTAGLPIALHGYIAIIAYVFNPPLSYPAMANKSTMCSVEAVVSLTDCGLQMYKVSCLEEQTALPIGTSVYVLFVPYCNNIKQ